MPLLLLQPTACATAAAAAAVPAPSAAFSRPPPSSRLRCSHLPFAFPRLRKYGRRNREPVAAAPTSDDDEEDEEETQAEDGDYDEDDVEMEVDEEEFLATRPKPMGFGEGKTYATDVEEQLLREMGLGGAPRGGDAASAKRGEGNSSAKETDLNDKGVQVRLWNLPKKKNIHKDLKQAFKGFPGLLSIDPAVSANKKTRDPICKGFAYLKLESADAATSAWSYLNFISQITPIIASPQHFLTSVPSLASRNHALILKLLPLACMRTFTDSTRFVEIYSCKPVAFGKVEKPISCCIVDGNSSVEPSNKASHATSQPRSKQLSLLVAS